MKPLFCLPLCFAVIALLPCVPAQGQPILHLDPSAATARLSVSGTPGNSYRLESCPAPERPGAWDFQATLALDGPAASWLDAHFAIEPQRFYRAIDLGPWDPERAQDFRLMDQQGKSRWLFYHLGSPTVRAVVLIFTGNGCVNIQQLTPTIKALTNRFGGQGVQFWLVDSNLGDNRSNILVTATSLGMSNGPPILHDAAQLVAKTYRATTAPESVAISTADLAIFYRGAIDDRLGAAPVPSTQAYLSNALTSFLAGQTVSPRETRVEGCALVLPPAYTNLSYSTDIAPILEQKCVRCHSPGNIAPFSMTGYEIVRAEAPYIRTEVMAGRMPPWHADPLYGRFTNDASLTSDQMAKLIQWLDEGAQRGTGPDPLPDAAAAVGTNYPNAWPTDLGPPDAILRIPTFTVPAFGTVEYQYISVTNNAFAGDVWLRAAIVRPGNTRVVHHCLVFEGNPSQSQQGLAGFYAGYVPGWTAASFPANTGKLLRRGQVFTFQMHYTVAGEVQTDQTEIGLYLAPAPPAYPLQTKAAHYEFFAIPANTEGYATSAQYPASGTLTTNILVYEMSPHMHLRGSTFRYEAFLPNGTRQVLLSVPDYIFHWQTLYRFATPVYLPRGTRISCTGSWDNTSRNVELMEAYNESGNASFLPNRTVNFGEQSWDEMFIGYLNYAEVPGPP
jgi:hypothetical protein